MDFVPAQQLISRAAREGYAVPAFCAWNAESVRVILRVAHELRAPVMLMGSMVDFKLLPPREYADMARAIARHYDVPAALHLDHGNSVALAEECLAAGFTSIMLDYSSRPIAENIAALRETVALCHPHGVTVEGEIGHVGRADQVSHESAHASSLTEPEEARRYALETGVDMLAVSIGNAHGLYTALPRFEFELLAELRRVVPVPLVLHGGSGTPDADLQRAISLGIVKVNVASDLVRAWRESLLAQWGAGRNNWAPTALSEATEAMAPVVARWIRLTGAAGKA